MLFRSGTLTVEAALVVPVFLFLMIAVLQYAQAMEASVCYGAALAEAGRVQAVQVYTAPDISGTGTAIIRNRNTGTTSAASTVSVPFQHFHPTGVVKKNALILFSEIKGGESFSFL